MGIHQFILALVLLLGLGQVAFAYPAFDPDHEVVEQGLKHPHNPRQGATANPFLNQEALCDKNCKAVDNACAKVWGSQDGNCIQNYNSCIKRCSDQFGKRELETRAALPVEEGLNRELLCDKNCLAIRNKCASDGGLSSVGACDKKYDSCKAHCALGFSPFGDRWAKAEVVPRDLPEAVEVEERSVEIEERASKCISLEGICQKNCMATRNKCVAPAGLLSGAMARCVKDYEICMAVCPFFEGQCVGKRDADIDGLKERAVEAKGPDTSTQLSHKKQCGQECFDARRKCGGHVIAPPACQQEYTRCVNVCSYLAPPGTKRAALPEPVEIEERAVEPEERSVNPGPIGLCIAHCQEELNQCSHGSRKISVVCESNFNNCRIPCWFRTELRADVQVEKRRDGQNHAKVCVGGRCLAHMSHSD